MKRGAASSRYSLPQHPEAMVRLSTRSEAAAYPVVFMPGPTPRRRSSGHRSISLSGETLFKDHPSHEIMLNIQLGVKVSLKLIGPLLVDLPKDEFTRMEAIPFPKAGSEATPKHKINDFSFKNFAPQVFAQIRKHSRISPEDYETSIAREFGLKEISTPGKSGALFYKTHDDRLLIKTITKMETKKLMHILPAYHAYILNQPDTLLPRFLQLFRITTSKGRRIRMIVMFNMLPVTAGIQQRFDLKGSTIGRASPALRHRSPSKQHLDFVNMRTMKDLDFIHLHRAIHVAPAVKEELMAQIQRDVALLESMNLMDYSLLLGIRPLSEIQAAIEEDESAPRQCHARILVATDEAGKPIEVHFGVIDILCRYTIGKQAETAYKSIRFGAGIASATSPTRYAQRFHNFLATNVFL